MVEALLFNDLYSIKSSNTLFIYFLKRNIWFVVQYPVEFNTNVILSYPVKLSPNQSNLLNVVEYFEFFIFFIYRKYEIIQNMFFN